jgi:branched-chain amino acid transport system permease protein
MDLILQLLANGVSNGSQYALLGIGFGLIFGTTGIVHFAYGPVFAATAYVMWWLIAVLGLPFPFAVVLGAAFAAGFGVLSYLVIYEPLVERGSPSFVILVASLGLFIVIANMLAIVFGTDAKTLPDFGYGIYFFGDVVVTGVQIAQVVVFVLVALLLAAFLKFGAWGNAIRAVTDNVEMARIVGIDTRKVAIVVFALGSMISAVAAANLLVREGASTHIGFFAVFYAFIAGVVGGVGSIWGAAIGGLLLGLVESTGMWKLPTEWQSTIAFMVLFVVMLWRPTGLLRGN